MIGIVWSDLLSAGCDDLDAEHKILVSLVNECVELSRTDEQDGRIVSAVVRLIVYTDQHFTNEERIMKQFGYPNTEEHTATHKLAMGQLHQLGLTTSGTKLCRDIGSYLTNWFFAHATTHDRKLGEWLSRECLQVTSGPLALGRRGSAIPKGKAQ